MVPSGVLSCEGEVKAAKTELEAIQAHAMAIKACKIELYAQLEMEDEVKQVAEHNSDVKTLGNVQ